MNRHRHEEFFFHVVKMHFCLPEKFETPVVMATLQTDCRKIRTQPQDELHSKLESLNHGIIKV